MSADTVAAVGAAKYVLLTTYRKDGAAVATPLWAAVDGADVLMWTVADSWKVKRIKRNPAVLIQACDMRGAKATGAQVAGTATIEGAAASVALIRKKYGVIGWLTEFGSRVRRGADGAVTIRIHDATPGSHTPG